MIEPQLIQETTQNIIRVRVITYYDNPMYLVT